MKGGLCPRPISDLHRKESSMTEAFLKILDDNRIEYRLNEPMKNHTTFKIGGDADILISVTTEEKLRRVTASCREHQIPYMILGKGSNLLVSDEGIEGAVIALDGVFKEICVEENTITCGAGVTLSKLCTVALENSLSGLEFAYGIPGSVGGAVYMNAGAYGGEMKDAVDEVVYLTDSGRIASYQGDALHFSYRHSVFCETGEIILFSKYKLHKDDPVLIKERMDDVMDRRRSKQPLEYPSAGSVFKRPKGAFAGTLIEQCGLKGKTVGGAQVSEKHAGFIINIGGASCGDVMELCRVIQDTVREKTGFELERELIRTGR